MKHKLLNSLLLLAVLFITQPLSAHWTTKGPYGGKVKCMTTCDTLVYVGTFDGGVYRSTNSFLTAWRYANYDGLTNSTINDLSSIGKKVIAATPTGIFRSSDMGAIWAAFNTGLTNTNVLSLIKSGSNIFAGTNGGGIFISSDSCVTWSAVNNGLTSMTVTCFAIDGSTIYAGTNNGVFVSTNNGGTWSAVNTGLSNTSVKTLVVSANTIFAGTNTGIFTSATSSINWSPTNTGLSNIIINHLYASGNTIFASTNGGVFTSPSSGVIWNAANTGYTDSVNVTVIYNNKIIAGTQSDGLLKSNSVSSISWSKSNTGFNNLEAFAIYNSGNLVIAATNKGLYVSTDLATTYVRRNNGLTDSLHVNCLTFVGPKLYAGTMFGGVFMSADTGKTWTSVNNGLTTMNIKRIIDNNTHLVCAAANGNTYSTPQGANNWVAMTGLPAGLNITSLAYNGATYLGAYGTGVYVTTDNSTWSADNTGLSNLNVTSLAGNVTSLQLFAGTDGGGIFEHVSGSWTPRNTGLSSMNILSIATGSIWVVAGYKGGVNASSNGGLNWQVPGTLFYIPAFADVTNISFSSLSTRVFVGTPHNSLYSNGTAEFPVGIKENVLNENAFVVYPNPSKGIFTIAVKGNDVVKEVEIYNSVGQLQHVSVSPDITFNGASGIYFAKIKTDKGIVTKKLVIE
ncbi:MAG: heme utilization protein [Bacteroidetes bacterium]|jgi:ligand-binding sensor domain-containing protein|nr:heme utilization protein [Bacteroidota bacterium]